MCSSSGRARAGGGCKGGRLAVGARVVVSCKVTNAANHRPASDRRHCPRVSRRRRWARSLTLSSRSARARAITLRRRAGLRALTGGRATRSGDPRIAGGCSGRSSATRGAECRPSGRVLDPPGFGTLGCLSRPKNCPRVSADLVGGCQHLRERLCGGWAATAPPPSLAPPLMPFRPARLRGPSWCQLCSTSCRR